MGFGGMHIEFVIICAPELLRRIYFIIFFIPLLLLAAKLAC